VDIIFIRNKLPTLIAINLIAENLISKNFIFVRHCLEDVNENPVMGDSFYKMIEEKAFYTMHIVENKGLIRCYLHVYLLSILAFISCGKFYLAGITYYPYSVAAKLNPFLKIITLDDGMANIQQESSNPYFSNKPYGDSSSILRKLLNFVFPHGPSLFIRKKTILHYTMYKHFENIVPREKLKYVKIDWESYLSDEDVLFLKRFNKPELSILIGTVFDEKEFNSKKDEQKRNFLKNFQKEFLPKLDLIISHPRDRSNISQLKIAKSFHGTSESVVEFLQNQSMVNKINVYHLGTSSTPIIKTFSKVKLYDIFAGTYETENNLVHLENL
jgi:hypothetical protein